MTWHFGAQLQLWLNPRRVQGRNGRQQSGVVGEQHTEVDCAGNHQFITMIPTHRSSVGRHDVSYRSRSRFSPSLAATCDPRGLPGVIRADVCAVWKGGTGRANRLYRAEEGRSP